MILVAYVEAGVGDQVSGNGRKNQETSKKGSSVGGQVSGISKVQKTKSQPTIPVLGIPACGMYHRTTVFDLVLPRILAGEYIGRRELAELGHGGLCLLCDECRYPVCPFGK